MDDNSTVPQHHKPLVLGVILGVILLFAVLIYLLRAGLPQSKNSGGVISQRNVASPTPAGRGVMTLTVKGGKTSGTVGAPITLVVSASSDQKAVSGLDAIIDFDVSKVAYKSQQSVVTDFQTLERREGGAGSIHITSIKKLASTTPSVFNTTPVVEVTFTPIAAGSVTFSLRHGKVPHSTIVTDEKSPKDILGKVEGVTITIAK